MAATKKKTGTKRRTKRKTPVKAGQRQGKKKAGRNGKGQWRPGTSGNPKGTKTGSRHRATRLAQELLDGEAEELVRRAVELAKGGDPTALKLVIERLLPPRRSSPVSLDLPALETAADALAASAALVAAIADGDLTPQEAERVGRVLDAHRRAIETAELAERLERLERQFEEAERGEPLR